MTHRRSLQGNEKIWKAASAIGCLTASVTFLLVAVTIPGAGVAEGVRGIALSAFFAFCAVVNAAALLPPRAGDARPHASTRTSLPESRKWTPPVNKEFESFGNAFFIAATPSFVPRWVVHADPESVLVPNLNAYAVVQFFRPLLYVIAAATTRLLGKPWTVTVERRNISGAGEWRFVLCKEYFSRHEAHAGLAQIVSDWSTMNYLELPFVEEANPPDHGVA